MTRDQIQMHVELAMGSMSMCWENIEKAGKFDVKMAHKIIDQLMTTIDKYHTGS